MKKVLLIDDDILVTTSLATSLQDAAFEVHIAYSGQEGIQVACQVKPDAIVLDLMMPGVSGWEVCREIRKFSQVPILVLSAVIDSELVMQALVEGATDYLIKPIPPGIVIAQLKRLTLSGNSTETNVE